MNYLNLFLLFSLISGSVFSDTATRLSSESKKSIKNSVINGALAGLAATAATAGIINIIDPKPIDRHELKGWAITGTVLSAAGALINGIWEYASVPEKQFDYAKETLSNVSQKVVVGMIYQTKSEDWINTLKGLYARSRYPLSQVFSNLNEIYETVVSAKRSLAIVLASNHKELHAEARELHEYASTTLTLLQAVLSKITAEPNYVAECAARAQEEAAIALKNAAIAQTIRLANELNRPKVVYVADARSGK